MSQSRPRRFLAALLCIYALLVAGLGLNLALLWRLGELADLNDIVQRQRRDGSIYNGLSHSFADYKYAASQATVPTVVALGTSRAMQIRQSFFQQPFYNLGGLARGPGQGNAVLMRLLRQQPTPEVAIFSLDYWTFCQPAAHGGVDRGGFAAETGHDGLQRPATYFLTYQLLLGGKIAPRRVLDVVRVPLTSAGPDRIGLSARVGGSAFAADGSIYAPPPPVDLAERWRESLDQIATGEDKFVKDCTLSRSALNALQRFTDRLDAAGMDGLLLLAPMPSIIIDRMRRDGRYGYIEELRQALAARFGRRFFDAFDMRAFAADSEFIDGIHGGEIVYMRALLQASRQPGSPLAGRLKDSDLEQQIARWAGHTQSLDAPVHRQFFLP